MPAPIVPSRRHFLGSGIRGKFLFVLGAASTLLGRNVQVQGSSHIPTLEVEYIF